MKMMAFTAKNIKSLYGGMKMTASVCVLKEFSSSMPKPHFEKDLPTKT